MPRSTVGDGQMCVCSCLRGLRKGCLTLLRSPSSAQLARWVALRGLGPAGEHGPWRFDAVHFKQ